ncbi:MAG TPA: hypothetical protein VEK73_15370 [Xanthobacteraceae bacterium]|nr:hypothetical protein [Xanthobacteraceae bacterium]
MGPSQPARRATHDRARRNPAIRPDYLPIYKVKAEAKPAADAPPAPAQVSAPPQRSRATRAFLIALIAAVAVNTGALIGLVGWGVLQAFGVFGEPAIETVQREHAASLARLDASVEALNASVMGLSAHVNAAGEREDAANRRVAEIDDALGVLRTGMNDLRAAQPVPGEEPWRQPVADLAASVAKVRGDVTGLRASLDERPRPPAGVAARLDRIEQAMIAHNLLGPMRGAIEPDARPAPPAARDDPATDGHIISLPTAD